MLESPASQRFIYSLLDTDSHRALRFKDGRFDCHFRRSNASDKKIQSRVKSTLEKLSNMIAFVLRKTLPGTGRDGLGLTTVTKGGDSIESYRIDILCTGFRETLKKDISLAELHRERFVLATTLCHEVIHAIDGMVTEKYNCQSEIWTWHHFESQTECEVGWAWEMEVFGAIRIGCDPTRDPYMLQTLPSLEQNPEELDFDGEQHICYVRPMESVVDYMTRPQRQEYWATSPRTATMLRISTQPTRSSMNLISNTSLTDPIQILEARAEQDTDLRALLDVVSSRTASQQQINDLQVRQEFFAKRQTTVALIRKIKEDHRRADFQEQIICLETRENKDGRREPSTSLPHYDDMMKELENFEKDSDSKHSWMASSDEDDDEVVMAPNATGNKIPRNNLRLETPDTNDRIKEMGHLEDDDDSSTITAPEYQDDAMELDANEAKGTTIHLCTCMAKSAKLEHDIMDLDTSRNEGATDMSLMVEPSMGPPRVWTTTDRWVDNDHWVEATIRHNLKAWQDVIT
ncbi:MAG: hypothetical protein LQ337_007235 [Flavoplaca oasis]|nr:MAG: hypothetical protein LQ337_007235 [Flavoplaca oasis]